MLMGTKQKLRLLPKSDNYINIEVQGQKIEQVTSQRLLRVEIDSCVSWNDQIQKVGKTVRFKISLLRKIRHYLPLDTRKLFFNYYIKPHLSYCSSIWGQTSKENHNRIIELQKQAARLILNRDYTNPSAELFNELDWQLFPDSVQYQQALLVYKYVNNLTPHYMKDMFQHVHDIGRTNLRSASDHKLFIPRSHQKSICFPGPKSCNNLTNETRAAKSLRQFKLLYHTRSLLE